MNSSIVGDTWSYEIFTRSVVGTVKNCFNNYSEDLCTYP